MKGFKVAVKSPNYGYKIILVGNGYLSLMIDTISPNLYSSSNMFTVQVRGKRAYIAELIRNLASSQNPGKQFRYFAILHPCFNCPVMSYQVSDAHGVYSEAIRTRIQYLVIYL